MRYIYYTAILMTALFFTACANAGEDQKVESGHTVILDANKSTVDFYGEIKKYRWKQVRGKKVKLLDRKSMIATFIAPNVSRETRLVFRLTTVEKGGYISPWRSRDRVSITILPSNTTGEAPVAVATVNETSIKYGNSVTFNGSQSSDSDGQIVSYEWTDKDNLTLSQSSIFEHTFSTIGTHEVKLTVTDDDGLSSNASVTVTVEELQKPIALIRSSATTIFFQESINFDANGSTDSDGQIVAYEWLDENNVTLSSEKSFVHTFTSSGEHTVTLNVTDDDGLLGTSSKNILVEAILTSVTLSIDSNTLEINETTQASVTAHYNDNKSEKLNSNVTWIISDETIVSIDEALKVKALQSGTSTLQVKIGDVSSSPISLEVLSLDLVAPIITLNGDSNITLIKGDDYDELGATAVDDKDGNVSVDINGSVDSSTIGIYTLIYTSIDLAGNSVTVSRTIHVTNNVKTLTLIASQTKYTRELSYYGKDADGKVINYYAGVSAPMQVVATFENGDKEEVTDKIEWILSNNAKTPYDSVVLTKEGTTTVQVQYQNVKSNVIELTLENYETTSKNLIKYTVYDSHIPGRGVDIRISLATQPLKPVTLVLELDPKDKVEFKTYRSSSAIYTKTLTFKPEEYRNIGKSVEIEDKDENNTNPYVIKTHVLESEDTNYGGKDPQDITFVPKNEIEFVVPPIAQRRGALRGVHISMLIKAYATRDVVFRLVDPPEGMYLSDGQYSHILDQEEMATKRPKIIEWDVPMDAIEGETYDITVEVTDAKKRKGSVTFPIKVPKTKPIQTEVVNNELIVTDKESALYGMKMKGHSGEDISELKIRSVDYGDVWKFSLENLESEDVVERSIFVLDDISKEIDIKFFEDIDTYKERLALGVGLIEYVRGSVVDTDFWRQRHRNNYEYEGSDGLTIAGKGVYMLVIRKSQMRGK